MSNAKHGKYALKGPKTSIHEIYNQNPVPVIECLFQWAVLPPARPTRAERSRASHPLFNLKYLY